MWLQTLLLSMVALGTSAFRIAPTLSTSAARTSAPSMALDSVAVSGVLPAVLDSSAMSAVLPAVSATTVVVADLIDQVCVSLARPPFFFEHISHRGRSWYELTKLTISHAPCHTPLSHSLVMLNGLAPHSSPHSSSACIRRFLLPSLPFSPSLNPCSHPFFLCQPPPTPHPSHTLVAHPFSLPPFSRIELTRVPHEHDRAGVRRFSYDHFSPASSYMVRPPTPTAPPQVSAFADSPFILILPIGGGAIVAALIILILVKSAG